MCERYKDVSSVISYVRKEIGTKEFEAKYGKWEYTEYSFYYDNAKGESIVSPRKRDNTYNRREPVELGEYTILLPHKVYKFGFDTETVTITVDEKTVLEYPIEEAIRQDTMLLHHPEQLLTYRNDSLMLVLEGIDFNDTDVTGVRYLGFQLFRKR